MTKLQNYKIIFLNYKFILLLCIIRITISVLMTNSEFSGDESFYGRCIQNFISDGNLSSYIFDGAIFPNHQWFVAIFYLPFFIIYENKILITVVNNICYIVIIFLLSKIWLKSRFTKRKRNLFFILFLFFPPMFEINNSMLSDNVFIYLLSVLIYLFLLNINNIKNKYLYYIILLFILICFLNTRPVSFVYLAIFICLMILSKKYLNVILMVTAILLAIIINGYIHNISIDNKEYEANQLFLLVYSSNTIYSDGSVEPNQINNLNNDDVYLSYKNKNINEKQLLENLLNQIWNKPSECLVILKNKLINYLFRIWPNSWSYPSKQNIMMKIYGLIFNSILYFLIFYGMTRSKNRYDIPKFYKLLFIFIFIINLGFHLIIISRYRYNIPILYLGLPFVYISIFQIKEIINKYIIKYNYFVNKKSF